MPQEKLYSYRGIPVKSSDQKGCKYSIFGSYHFKSKSSTEKFIDSNVHKKRMLPAFQKAGDLSVNITPWQDAVTAVESLTNPAAVMDFVKGEHRKSVKQAAVETVERLKEERQFQHTKDIQTDE